MPQKGRFVEEVATQSSNFTSASKGQISDKSLGSLFAGAGSVVGSAIEVADNQFQESIENKVDDFYAQETEDQDPAVMELSSEGVPSEITNGTENIIKMSKAYGNGLISDSQFFMRASSLAKRLKSQYPGHKNYVDAAIGKARGTSANIARKSLLNELDKLSTASQRKSADTQKALNKSIAKGFTTPERVQSLGREAALQEALVLQGQNESLNRDMDNIGKQIDTGMKTKDEASDQFIGNLGDIISTPVNMGLARGMGYQGNLGNFTEFSAWMNSIDPSTIEPDRLELIFKNGNQLIGQIESSVLTNETFQKLGNDGQKKVREALDRQLAGFKQYVGNKDFNGLKAATEAATIGKTQEYQLIKDQMGLEEIEIQRMIINDIFPEGSEGRAVTDRLLSQKWEKPAMKLIAQGLMSRVFSGDMPVGDMFTKLSGLDRLSDADKGKAMFAVIEASKQVFKTRDPNDPRFKDVANAMFREHPNQLLRHWPTQAARLDMINFLIDPALSEKIMKTDPQTARAYQDFVVGAFSAVTTSEIGDLNKQAAIYLRTKDRAEALGGRLGNMQIAINPEKGRFEVTNMTGTISPQQRVALESMQKINSLLDKIIPILTTGGVDNPQALSLLLSKSRQDFDKDPWASNISETMGDWWTLLTSQDALERNKRHKE